MFDLPQSFLILPNPESKAFSKTLRKTHLLLLRFLLQTPIQGIPKDLQISILHLRPILSQVLKREPQRLIKAIATQDTISALILLRNGQADPILLWKQAITSLFFQLETLPEDFLWEHPIEQVILEHDLLEFNPPIQSLSIGPLGISGQYSNGKILSWEDLKEFGKSKTPFTKLSKSVSFSLFDSNPFSMEEAHPDKDGNATQLGGHSVEEWCETLEQAIQIIKDFLPEWWAEFDMFMHRLVPVGYYPQKHLSASYAEAPGLAYLSLHPDLLTMTEALVHEAQHSKINLVRLFDPLLHNGLSELTSSPLRPDRRPLHGVLLAAHAFVPVAALHYRLEKQGHPIAQTPQFRNRRLEVLEVNKQGLAILKEKGKPTKIGEAILKGLEALHLATSS